MRSCEVLSVNAPSCTGGQVKPPASSRFVTRQRPEPSQRSSLIRSVRLARKTKISPANGSADNVCITMATRPSMPLRKSTGLGATITRRPGLDGMPKIIVQVQSGQAPAAMPPDRPRLLPGHGPTRSLSQSIPQVDHGPITQAPPRQLRCSRLPPPQCAPGQNAAPSAPARPSPYDAMSKVTHG